MPQSRLLKARGLYTYPNQLSEIPQGALTTAKNVNIDRDSVIEPRRGFPQYGDTMPNDADRAKQLLVYKGRILRHFGSTIEFDSDGQGSFSAFSGTFNEVDSGLRIKSAEANGNFYFTTNSGIKKISATSANQFTTASNYITDAGGPKALSITAEIDYSSAGFLTTESKVAYRVVWAKIDTNNNLILGAPSSRTIVTNFSTTASGVVDLQFTIPNSISSSDTSYFYQVYRTAVSQAGVVTLGDIDPGDEMNLIIEEFPTSSELSSRVVSVTDVTPEDFRDGGTPLYTNPVSGDGILQANNPPPVAKDITIFSGHTFYSNTRTIQNLNLSLLSVSQLTSGSSTLTITDGSTTNTYTFVGEAETTKADFSSYTGSIPGDLDGKYWKINSARDERKYYVWYNSGGATDPGTDTATNTDLVGRLGIEVDTSSGVTTKADLASVTSTTLNNEDDFTTSYTASNAFLDVTTVKNGNTIDSADGSVNGIGNGFSITTPTQGDGEDSGNLEVLLSSEATPSQQIDESARSLVNIINQNSGDIVQARYLSGPDDVPGLILLEAKSLSTDTFYLTVDSDATGTQFNPVPPTELAGTAATGSGTVTITSTGHGLSDGTEIVIYNSATTPDIDGIYTISNTTTNTFDISTTVSSSGSVTFAQTSAPSDNEVQPNTLYYSKFQEPEAVPSVNNIPVGSKDKAIQRILPLRESMFILKESGIYRLTGQAGNFLVDLFDDSINILAPDSAVVLNNQIYALSSDGVITISDTGIEVISRPIEGDLIEIMRSDFSFKTATFGVSYETDRAYLLWTVTNQSDTNATRCFRWNTFTKNWTEWPIPKTCGVVNDADDKLYLGVPDQNFIERERKNYNRRDYADRDFALTLGSDAVGDNTLQLSSITNAEDGDALVQTQYVTLTEFNRLLRKLDLDPGLNDTDYNATLELSPGDNLSTAMTNLVSKLNADSGTASAYTFSGSTDFAAIQTEYNTIISTLNTDTGVIFTNYKQSSGTVEIETTILEKLVGISAPLNTVRVRFNLPFLEGPIVLYKFIPTDVIWAPYTFGDPSVLKQIREGTILFKNNIFTSAQVLYSSDLSQDFESVDFDGQGNGDWGNWFWGQLNWGGQGSQVPLRTYIPRDKQRCRFINQRFKHQGAREKFSIFGISYTFRPISERAYRDI